MSNEWKLPGLGENIEEGTLIRLLVKTGDAVRAEQPLMEVETGKATIEVPAPFDATVGQVLVREGEKVKVGQPVLILQPGAAEAAPAPAAPAAPAAAAVAAPAKTVATPPPPPPPPPAETARITRPPEQKMQAAAPGAPRRIAVAAAPHVRRFAREIGVDIDQVEGHGKSGRISVDDVKKFARQANSGRPVKSHCLMAAVPNPDFGKWGPTQKESMSAIRVATAEHMQRCWATIPHVTHHEKADVTELEALRKRFAPRAEAAGGKLTVTAILMKVVSAALKVHPKFNASLDMSSREVVYKKYYNIGLAVETERGLLVPVVRDVDRKNIIQLAVEIGQLADKARKGKLSPDEMSGGTFTITNLGGLGTTFFTPIVNAPEVAILGIGRAIPEPAHSEKNDLCQVRLRLPLSLSYDHRLIDGADGARFMKWLVEAIEEPMLISLEG